MSETIDDIDDYVRRVKLAIAGYHRQEHVSTWVARKHLEESVDLLRREQFVVATAKVAAQIAANELHELREKFPCGHRKIDWDDSYGGCVFCKIKQQADDYDRLILCHHKIEVLEAERGDEYIKALMDAKAIVIDCGDQTAARAIQFRIDEKRKATRKT